VYTLTAVYNFINMCNPDNLNSFKVTEDKEIDKKDTRLAKEESNIVINQRRNKIAQLI